MKESCVLGKTAYSPSSEPSASSISAVYILGAGRFQLRETRALDHKRAGVESWEELYKRGLDSRTGHVTAMTTANTSLSPLSVGLWNLMPAIPK